MIDFEVIRNNDSIGFIKGSKDSDESKKKFIFNLDVDVKVGDWVREPQTNFMYYIIDVDIATFAGELVRKHAYFLTQAEYNNKQKS